MAFSNTRGSAITQPMNEINMTPFVDVMLVLLVIFLITAPLMNHAIPVDLPKAQSSALETVPNAIQLIIDEEGNVLVNGVPTLKQSLEQVLRDSLTPALSTPELHLRADRHIQYERVVEVMSAANKAGITRISFVTEQSEFLNEKPSLAHD
jgi:biopolymer transport protein ExbD